MNFSLSESSFSEVYRLLATNIDKINFLNSSLIKSSYNYLKIKQFLNEFEYDLKLIYDILSLFQKESNNKNNNEPFKQGKRKNKYLNLSDRLQKHLHLNDFEETSRNNYKRNENKDNKKYSLTINILSDKYFDSKGKMRKKFNKSNSCKSYKKKFSKNIMKNLKKLNLRGNSYSHRNTEKNNKKVFEANSFVIVKFSIINSRLSIQKAFGARGKIAAFAQPLLRGSSTLLEKCPPRFAASEAVAELAFRTSA